MISMKRFLELVSIPLIVLLAVSCSCCDTPLEPVSTAQPPARILFVGNSHTYFNEGVDTHLEGIVSASNSFPPITASSIAFAGHTLQNHWYNDSTRSTIQEGDWDVVVLQEHSTRSITDTETMYTYARLLDQEVSDTGARTVFFMTWAWRDRPEMIEDLEPVYRTLSEELEAELSPVGLAWQRSQQENPDLDLYNSDGFHPNYHGTYLAACVFYAVLWGVSPEGNSYSSHDSITEEEREFLQRIAWETVTQPHLTLYRFSGIIRSDFDERCLNIVR